MRVIGIFPTLAERPTEGLDIQADCHIKSLASRGVEWLIIVFSKTARISYRNLSSNVAIIAESNRFSVLARRSFIDVAIWLVSGHRRWFLARIHKVIAEASPDIVYIEGLPLAPLAIALGDHPVVLSCIDAMSLRHFRLMMTARSLRLAVAHANAALISFIFEVLFLKRCSAVHLVSEVDAAYLRRVAPRANIRVIPIRAPAAGDARHAPRPPKDCEQFVIWGDVSVPHLRAGLVNFFLNVAPLISSDKYRFTILGRKPPDVQLRNMLDHYGEQVSFLEWAPDLDRMLMQCGAVLLLDQSGTGLKNRVIHAMSLGAVVIGTPSAFEGIPVTDRKDAYICRTPGEFGAAIREVERNQANIGTIQEAGSRLVEELYSDAGVSRQWLALFAERCLSRQKRN